MNDTSEGPVEASCDAKTICSDSGSTCDGSNLVDVRLEDDLPEKILENGVEERSDDDEQRAGDSKDGTVAECQSCDSDATSTTENVNGFGDDAAESTPPYEVEPAQSNVESRADDGPDAADVDHIEGLQLTIAKQKIELERSADHIKHLERVSVQQGLLRAELDAKFQILAKQYEAAIKDKEATVVWYAVSEKNVIDQRNARELAEKQLRDAVKENESLAHKLSTTSNEKTRICQMLDNKCYELNAASKEVEKLKCELANRESKLKWAHNNLRVEIDAHKDSAARLESTNVRLQEATAEIERAKRDAQDAIRAFRESQENRAYVLDRQLKEQAANLILARHERDDREQQCKHLLAELDKLQAKHQSIIQENNTLSLKVQQLEKERLETEKKLSELREHSDKRKQDSTDLQNSVAQLEQFRLQLSSEKEKNAASHAQIDQLKQRNHELQTDTEACRLREAEMLHFTQMLTEKNVRLQSEFTALEMKVQQLACEQTTLKRSEKELKTRLNVTTRQLDDEKAARAEENKLLTRHIAERTQSIDRLTQQIEFEKGENAVIRRKYETSLKEMTKELQQCHKKLEQYESVESHSRSHSSSSSSLNTAGLTVCTPSPVNSSAPEPDDRFVQPVVDPGLDKQTLLEHIMKLQRASARKSEKLDFLEEHVRTLVAELQRKSKLLQHYMMREQTGALSSDTMDQNKAEVARSKGVMASMYGSRITDDSLTLELSLDINRKLQAVLEDTLLKNITLKESVDTLGVEIERLTRRTVDDVDAT